MSEIWCEKISRSSICRGLKKNGFTRKKTFGYKERDEIKRQEFLLISPKIPPENIVYGNCDIKKLKNPDTKFLRDIHLRKIVLS